MKTNYLLPSIFKNIGLLFFIPFTVLGIFVISKEFYFDFLTVENFRGKSSDFLGKEENFTNELAIIGTLLSLFFIAFSREKIEDEFIQKTRLESLLWAIYLNFILVIIVVLTIYGANFYTAITNMIFAPLIIFIVRFNYILHWKSRFLI